MCSLGQKNIDHIGGRTFGTNPVGRNRCHPSPLSWNFVYSAWLRKHLPCCSAICLYLCSTPLKYLRARSKSYAIFVITEFRTNYTIKFIELTIVSDWNIKQSGICPKPEIIPVFLSQGPYKMIFPFNEFHVLTDFYQANCNFKIIFSFSLLLI